MQRGRDFCINTGLLGLCSALLMRLITISIFDSADEAFASSENAADWVIEFTKGMPEVMVAP